MVDTTTDREEVEEEEGMEVDTGHRINHSCKEDNSYQWQIEMSAIVPGLELQMSESH